MSKWQLPHGWAWKEFSEISVVNPRRPSIQRQDNEPTSFVPMEDVDEVEGKFKQIQVKPFEGVKRGYTYFEEGDVLFAKITPSMENGKTAIARNLIDGFGFGTTEFHVFRPHEGIMSDWIHYFIRRTAFRNEAKQHFRGAVGQQRVPTDFLESYMIPIPYPDDPPRSLDIQRHTIARIEALLAEVREMRGLNIKIASDTDRLFKTTLSSVFGDANHQTWDLHKLEDLVDNHDNIRVPVRKADRENMQGIYPYYGASGIIDHVDDYLFDGQYLLISEDGANLVVRKYPIAFVAEGKFWVNNHAHVVLAKPELTSNIYLAYAIEATDISRLVTGSAQPKLNQTKLNSMPLWLPKSRRQQDAIVALLQNVEKEIAESKQIVNRDNQLIQELESSILAQAFRGGL